MKDDKDNLSNKSEQEQQQDGVVYSSNPGNAMIGNYVNNYAQEQQQNQNLNYTIEMESVKSEYVENYLKDREMML